jgi:hypothetical protein
MGTPELYLQTAFVLDGGGRILSTREPGATPGPLFALVRNEARCAWAVHADLPSDVARELDRLARDEPAASELRAPLVHGERYLAAVEGWIGAGQTVVSNGPAFAFPDCLPQVRDVVVIDDERLLQRHFRGWVPGEIAEGRSPVLAVVEEGFAVSACFCARRSDTAALAGLETAAAFRGRGHAARATAAWALAIRETGRTPLYSTAWDNAASLQVTRKLNLAAYAATFSYLRRS